MSKLWNAAENRQPRIRKDVHKKYLKLYRNYWNRKKTKKNIIIHKKFWTNLWKSEQKWNYGNRKICWAVYKKIQV